MSDKFSAYEMYGIGDVTQDELEDLKKMYELWLEAHSQTLDDSDLFPSHGAGGREIKYDEQIVAYPRVTSEDLTANHAAGLPLTRERIVRCKDCKYGFDECSGYLYCGRRPGHCFETHADGFCSWAERRGD